MKALRSFLFSAIAVVIFSGETVADITVRELPSGQESTLQAESVDGVLQASIPEFFEQLGFVWQWDSGSRKLTCERGNERFVFIQDISYFFHDSLLITLQRPVERIGPTLCLPLRDLLETTRAVSGCRVRWDGDAQVLSIESSGERTGRTPPPAPTPPVSAATATEGVAAGAGAIRTVVIDAGHGGFDPGALGPGGVMEKNITLSIALLVRDFLNKKGNLKVYLTRQSDEFVGLRERTKMANAWKADLFISIHANSMPGSQKNKETAKGYKVYFLSEAKNEADKMVAMRENAVVELESRRGSSDLKNVLIDLAGNEYLRESQELSILLDRQFESRLGKKIGRLQEGIGQANFWVLNGAYMPSVLIETGFVSNPSDEKLLTQGAFQRTMAEAICNAVLNFKTKYEKGL